MTDLIHTYTYPLSDLIGHDISGVDCTCGPDVVPYERDDGSYGWQVVHHSLNGRETNEHDDPRDTLHRPGRP